MRTVPLLVAALAAATPAAAQVVYLGGEIPVNTTAGGAQVAPALAAGSTTGRFLVAWQSFDQDGSGAGVYGRAFEADGTPVGPEVRLNSTTAGEQITPAVASRYDLFKAVWASQNKDGDGYGIVLRLFDESGQPIGGTYGGELLVNQTTAGSQIQPDLAMADPGFVVVWTVAAPGPMLVGLLITGVGVGVHWPLGIARAIRASAGRADRASGLASVAAGLAAAGAPFVLAGLADAVGVHAAFLVVPVLLVTALALVLLRPVPD